MHKEKKVVHSYLVLNVSSLIKESRSLISILLKVECSELCVHKAMAPQPGSPAFKPHPELQKRMLSEQRDLRKYLLYL